MPKRSAQAPAEPIPGEPRGNPLAAVLAAYAVPGAGHLYLGRWGRGLLFSALVLACAVLGCLLDGRLSVTMGSIFETLRTVGSMGAGLVYWVLRFVLGYEGDVRSAGYEYGSAFLVTAGLMNLLLVFDAWDIATGRKS